MHGLREDPVKYCLHDRGGLIHCILSSDLEQKYGQTLIKYALGYLTQGQNGLSETELEDVLSCNDEVRILRFFKIGYLITGLEKILMLVKSIL